jgi:hypothetical protein
VNTQQACDTLNWLLEHDPRALRFWEMAICPANEVTLGHPTIPVDEDPQSGLAGGEKIYRMSAFGLLNGMLAQAGDRLIVAVSEEKEEGCGVYRTVCFRPATVLEMQQWTQE